MDGMDLALSKDWDLPLETREAVLYRVRPDINERRRVEEASIAFDAITEVWRYLRGYDPRKAHPSSVAVLRRVDPSAAQEGGACAL